MSVIASFRGFLAHARAGHRTAAREALARAFPDQSDAARARRARRAFAWQAAEHAAARAAQRLPLVTLCRRLHLEGWEHLQGVAPESGLLFLSVPPASAILALLPLALYRAPLLVTTGQGLAPLADLGKEQVERVQEEALEARLEAGARAGWTLALHRPETAGVELPFLGGRTRADDRLARLSQASGAPVVPVFTLPARAGRFAVTLTAPIPPTDAMDAAALTGRYLAAVEEAIGRHPERWPWKEQLWLG